MHRADGDVMVETCSRDKNYTVVYMGCVYVLFCRPILWVGLLLGDFNKDSS